MNKQHDSTIANLLISKYDNDRLREENDKLKYQLTIAQKPGQSPGDDKTGDNRHDKGWPPPGTQPKEGDRPNKNLLPLARMIRPNDIMVPFSVKGTDDLYGEPGGGSKGPLPTKKERDILDERGWSSNPGLSIAGAPQRIKGPVPHGIISPPGGPHIDSRYIDNQIKRNWQPMRIQDIKPGGPQLPWFLSQISQLTPAKQLEIIKRGAEVYKKGGTSQELRDTIEPATYPDWRGNPSGSIRPI